MVTGLAMAFRTFYQLKNITYYKQGEDDGKRSEVAQNHGMGEQEGAPKHNFIQTAFSPFLFHGI